MNQRMLSRRTPALLAAAMLSLAATPPGSADTRARSGLLALGAGLLVPGRRRHDAGSAG